MKSLFTKLWQELSPYLYSIGDFTTFFGQFFKYFLRKPTYFSNVIEHIYFIGNKGLFIICFTSVFLGMVFALQMFIGLEAFSIHSMIGTAVTMAMSRELAPVLTGIIVSGRVGSAMAAELGTMRITEQIDAIEVMGINPFSFLVIPRIMASTITLPLLTIISNLVGNFGAWFVATQIFMVDNIEYFARVNDFVRLQDVVHGIIKSVFFGLIVSVISCYFGYRVKNGASGVGIATNKAVVWSMVAIIVFDYILTSFIVLIL